MCMQGAYKSSDAFMGFTDPVSTSVAGLLSLYIVPEDTNLNIKLFRCAFFELTSYYKAQTD